MSGLTKKTVLADRLLSALLGVGEGELVSYAQLSKGLHKYIKDNDLKNPTSKASSPPILQPAQPTGESGEPPRPPSSEPVPGSSLKKCRDCGADISSEAVFCDLCGVKQ